MYTLLSFLYRITKVRILIMKTQFSILTQHLSLFQFLWSKRWQSQLELLYRHYCALSKASQPGIQHNDRFSFSTYKQLPFRTLTCSLMLRTNRCRLLQFGPCLGINSLQACNKYFTLEVFLLFKMYLFLHSYVYKKIFSM